MSDMVEMIWEKTRSKMFQGTHGRMQNTSWSPIRAKVPGGWLLTWHEKNANQVSSLTFVPDPNHEWQ